MMGAYVGHKALSCLTYGMYIVTSRDNGKLNGLICNTITQVTSRPAKIAIAINKKSLTHEYIAKSGVFAVSVIAQSAPKSLIQLFGYKSGRDIDKLSQVAFKMGATGCPIITENTIGALEGRVTDRVDAGAHTVFIAEVVADELLGEGEPLTYHYYQKNMKGRAPKSAPTYRPPTPSPETTGSASAMTKYVCNVCGYVYDPAEGDPDNGIEPGTSFGDLPDDWVCPVCGVGKNEFSPEE